MCRTPSQSYKGHLSRGECSHIWLELGNRHENDGLICVLLERKTEEDNAPAENRKSFRRSISLIYTAAGVLVFYHTKNSGLHYGHHQLTIMLHLSQKEVFPTVPNSKKYQ